MSRIKARLQTILSILRHPIPGKRPSPAECKESVSPQDTLHTYSGKLQKQNWNVDTIVMRLFFRYDKYALRYIKIVVIDSKVITSNINVVIKIKNL